MCIHCFSSKFNRNLRKIHPSIILGVLQQNKLQANILLAVSGKKLLMSLAHTTRPLGKKSLCYFLLTCNSALI